MTRHLEDEILLRFVDGDLPEEAAVKAALHIDACPHCANRAVSLEPLAQAFAAVRDPQLPADLEARVMEELAQPAPQISPGWLPWLGGLMIAAAGALMLLAGDPTTLVWQLAMSLKTLAVAAQVVLRAIPSPMTLLLAIAVVAFGCSLTAFRLLGLSRESA